MYNWIKSIFTAITIICTSMICATATMAQQCEYDNQKPLKFHTSEKFIHDQHNRVVIFRGANLGTCYYRDGIGFTEENLVALKNAGFNFIRLNLGWDILEPEKGQFDTERMKLISAFIEKAQEYGLYTMPDFHQMLWEAHIPHWMRDENMGHDYLSEMSPVAAAQSDRFWDSEELQADLINFLEFMAGNFKDLDGLFGYDLFNEPFSIKGTSYAIFEKCCLFPFYEKAIPAVRAIDPVTPIVLEPHPQSVVLPAYTREFDYDNIVYSPHVYFPHSYGPSGLVINAKETPDDVKRKYKRFQKDAEKMKAPWIVGEYGGDPITYPFTDPWLRENMKMMDRYLVGSAIWSFHAKGGGGWNINDTAGTIKPHMADILVRPYPHYTAGTPEKLMYDAEKKAFRFLYTPDSNICAPTEIFYPEELFEASETTISSECEIEQEYDSAAQMLKLATTCDSPVEIKILKK